jgi:hypothetical protein
MSAARSGCGPASAAIVCPVISAELRGSCSSIIASAVGSRSKMLASSRESAVMSMIAPIRSSGTVSPESRLSSRRV